MIDCNASLHEWAGRDARAIRMVLREVDVARCTFGDLAVLALDVAEVREILRPDAVLVTDEPTRTVCARVRSARSSYTPEISPRGKPRSGDLFHGGVVRVTPSPRRARRKRGCALAALARDRA